MGHFCDKQKNYYFSRKGCRAVFGHATAKQNFPGLLLHDSGARNTATEAKYGKFVVLLIFRAAIFADSSPRHQGEQKAKRIWHGLGATANGQHQQTGLNGHGPSVCKIAIFPISTSHYFSHYFRSQIFWQRPRLERPGSIRSPVRLPPASFKN